MCRNPRLGTKSDFNHLDFFFAEFLGSNFVFKKVRFWRSHEFPSVIGTSVVKSDCPNCLYFWGDFLGEGVNDSICVETLDLAPKMTSTISVHPFVQRIKNVFLFKKFKNAFFDRNLRP